MQFFFIFSPYLLDLKFIKIALLNRSQLLEKALAWTLNLL